jgi:hypothetical protein
MPLPSVRYRGLMDRDRGSVEWKAVRYGAGTVEEAQRRYAADATLYVQTGWVVVSVAWDMWAQEPTLVATYAHGDEDSVQDVVVGIDSVVAIACSSWPSRSCR